MCYYWDSTTGQTTDPNFVAALIELIREKTAHTSKISVIESDASAMKCKFAFKMLGYEKLSQDYEVPLVNLSEDKSNLTQVNVGEQRFSLKIPQTIQKADLKINVPKIKYTPRKTKLTCALKNIFGCNPYPKKFRYHPRLEEVVVAINKLMRFDLCLIDGNIVSGSQPRRMGLVMASQDQVAIDVAAAKVAGLNPNTLAYIRLACKEGLGSSSFLSRGLPLDYFRDRYPRKNVKEMLIANAYSFLVLARLDKRLGIE
jgi:uncharacterized protein (DUF362 family)